MVSILDRYGILTFNRSEDASTERESEMLFPNENAS